MCIRDRANTAFFSFEVKALAYSDSILPFLSTNWFNAFLALIILLACADVKVEFNVNPSISSVTAFSNSSTVVTALITVS